MSDKQMTAYFHTEEEAKAIAAKLMALRASSVSVDKISQGRHGSSNFLSGAMLGLSSIAPSVDFHSEMGYGVFGELPENFMEQNAGRSDGRSAILTASVNEDVFEKAVRLIETGGGSL
jgi:hypothetical protein